MYNYVRKGDFMKKLISIVLSILMVVSVMPLASLTAYAAPSTKKQATSVAVFSDDYLKSAKTKYYFDSLQDCFDYASANATEYSCVTLLADITLDEPAVLTDDEDNYGNNYFLELAGHTINAPNGNAIELVDMWCNFYVNYLQNDEEGGNGIDGFGAIYAKDYAFVINDMSLVITGGTYSSQTMEVPFLVNDPYKLGAICNIRQSAIVKTENIVYNGDGTFGSNGNVFLRYTTKSDGTKDHFGYFHVVEKTVDEQDIYVVENHQYTYVTEYIAPDRQSAEVSYKCACGLTKANVQAEALIGDTAYVRFSQAISAIPDGETATIEVLKDFTASGIVAQNGTSITVEMNGHTMTHPNDYIQANGGYITFKNGTINSNSNMTFLLHGSTDATVEKYSSVTLDNMVVNNTYSDADNGYTGTAIFLNNPGWGKPYKYYGITLDIIGSTVTSLGECVANNGNYANLDEYNTTKINFVDSHLISEEATAFYMAGYAICNSTNTEYKGFISGAEIRAGIFNVLGNENTFTSTYTGDTEVVSNKSGTTTTGAGLAIAQHNLQPNPNPVKVNIYGGEFNGSTALIEKQVQNVPTLQQDVTIKIYDGEFNGTNDAVITDSCTGFIEGGKYSVDPDESYIFPGLSTRLDEDDMYVLTDLDYSAYRTAVAIAKQIDRSIYTDESLANLDASIVAEKALDTQSDINNQTTLVQTMYNALEYRSYTVTFVAQTEQGDVDNTTVTYKYGEVVTFDASYIDEDVYKWTIETDDSTKKLPSDKKIVSFVVKSDSIITVFTKQNKTTESSLTKITYISNKNVTIGIDYVENPASFEKMEAPEVPFYVFDKWEPVDDTTYKAVYKYDDAKYCKFVGGMNVTITNGGNVSKDNDEGINVPYDELVEISASVEGQLALSANKEGTDIITYINDVTTIHAPKRETVYVIILPKVSDATVGVTGGYVKFEVDGKKKLAINGQFYLPSDCTLVDNGIVLCNKNGDFKIGGAGVVKLSSSMLSPQNEFTVTLTTNYGTMQYVYARTYLTYASSDGTTKTIYSDVKTADISVEGTLN